MPVYFIQPLLKQSRFSFQPGRQLRSKLGIKIPELGSRHRVEIAIPPSHHMPAAIDFGGFANFEKRPPQEAAF